MGKLHLGTARARQGPAAALIDVERGTLAACEENRLTRAREVGTVGPPELAIAELLRFLGCQKADIAETQGVGDEGAIEPHRAHATYARHASGFASAPVVVCDAATSVWRASEGEQGQMTRILDGEAEYPLAREFAALTERLGLRPRRDEHMVEAMARAGQADAAPGQQRIGEGLLRLLEAVRSETGSTQVCLSGGLFFNTYFTTLAARSGIFADTYVPPHPGRNGSAIGAAVIAGGNRAPRRDAGSPFLGPRYSDAEIKEALENCKLSFDLLHEERLFDQVLHALSRGRLVGWFHGRLEWGPRALGHRSVLADPFAPHVLDNLNGFLKRRPAYRTYGVSVPKSRLNDYFEAEAGPAASPFMQFEYRPRDPQKFKNFLPPGVKTLRVHTVDEDEPRVHRLLELWGDKTGTPILVNTSYNGFHEPLVCSPRDAIRVFYGTGLDVLALEDFFLHK